MTTTTLTPAPVSHPKRSTAWIIVGAVMIVSGFLTAISGAPCWRCSDRTGS